MNPALLCLTLLAAPPVSAQTTFEDELWVPGKTGVGVSAPGARFEARGSSATSAVFQASGVDLSAAFRLGADGTLGLSTASAARVTVSGSADSGDVASELRGGDLWPATSSYQLTLGYAGGASYRHAIRSRHAAAVSSNSLTFLIWTPAVSSGDVASREVLSLVTHSTGATVHILPPPSASTTTVELAVSNGVSLGQGTMRRGLEQQASSAVLKEDIEPLGLEAEASAYARAKELRHVRFKYKGAKRPPMRGLIFDEAPAEFQAQGGALSTERRLMSAELAAKELLRRLSAAEAEARGEPR